LARAELEAGNPRVAYSAALRAVAAARRERSFFMLFNVSKMAADCVQHGALGPTWRWSQLAPFLDNIEEAVPHLKRWMPPARLEQIIEGCMAPMQRLRRRFAHSDRLELDSRRAPPAPVVAATVANRRAWCRELLMKAPSGPQPIMEVAHRTCADCGKKQMQMHKCSRCKAAFYCDAACQQRHWREHKAACGAAAAAGAGGGQAGA
jgi:hypothetical protein